MFRGAALAFVALFSVSAPAQTTEFPRSPAPITIFTQFDNVTSNLTVQTLKAELADIMNPIGLHFEWRSLEESRHQSTVSAELVVVTFHGTCAAEDFLPGRLTQGALGWTHVSDGQLLPFSEVDCDRIRQFINPLVTGYDPEDRDRILGRAAGRVLAHELYHIFANTMHHTRGLAKGFYTAGELVSPAFRFENKEFQALRNNKLRDFLRMPRPPAPAGAGQ